MRVTAAVTAGYLFVEFGVDPPDEPSWRGGILFDRAVRDALRGKTRHARDTWAVASDVLALIPQGLMLVDSLVVPLVSDHGNFDVAWQLSMIAAQSEAITALLSRAGHHGVGRERPDVVPCRSDRGYSASCFSGSLAGFPGGHAAGAFVGAGVVCAHHLHLPLYGGLWDPAVCLTTVGVASAGAYARMAADRHYLSDTLVGVALGASAGFVLPSLLYYGMSGETAGESAGVRWMLIPFTEQRASGLGVLGSF